MPPEAVAFSAGTEPAIRGEVVGEGPPIVLCHGITATRHSVIHGSRRLERSGHTVVSYDARGHGESDPAPPGAGYGYPELRGDLATVIDEQAAGGPVLLAGHSMGAHTAVGFALEDPGRVAGLVVIGPAYDGEIGDDSLRYWDGLAAALERDGIDGFLAYIDRVQGIDPRWRDSVLRFTRERMERHRHPEALVTALREVPDGRARGPDGANAGRRQPRRRRPGPSLRGRQGVRGAHPRGPLGQRARGAVTARLAGGTPLARD
jgi:pimeloyl-ACP methyl ester carboxylesterase